MKNKLFIEANQELLNKNSKIIKNTKIKNVLINSILLDENNVFKKDKGYYYTLDISNSSNYNIMYSLKKVLGRIIKKNKYKKILVIGLGNSNVLADSFGPLTTKNVMATRHLNFLTIPSVAIFNPEIIEKTGISSYNLIKMVVSNIKPDVILIIDSLATSNKNHLNNIIEINNYGIIPGSAIKENKEINSHSFNIPIISIGVPFILEIGNYLYTTYDLKEQINKLSNLLSISLNELIKS